MCVCVCVCESACVHACHSESVYVCACADACEHAQACVRLRVREVMTTGVAAVSVVAQKISKLSDI